MAYHEEESTRLRRQSSRQAISLAMEGRWREAITANQKLIENFPNDVDAYNRLGRAHLELGEYALSKDAYRKALKVDPYNTIAQKNLARLSHLKDTRGLPDGQEKVEPQQFIEEVGKAGVVSLRKLAPVATLAKAVAGSKVTLKVDGAALLVENNHGEYLGQVEPRHAPRLIKLMSGGNRYSASIVSSAENSVTVIIREVYQDPSQVGKTSFPSRGPESIRAEMDERLGDRIIRRTLEHLDEDQNVVTDTGFAIVGSDGTDVEEISEQLEEGEDDTEEEE